MTSPTTARETCPDCDRPKARNAHDCMAGDCPKWYAIRDAEAELDCFAVRDLKQAAMPTMTTVSNRDKLWYFVKMLNRARNYGVLDEVNRLAELSSLPVVSKNNQEDAFQHIALLVGEEDAKP